MFLQILIIFEKVQELSKIYYQIMACLLSKRATILNNLKNMFDYIYHEHFSYFSLGVLKKFFKQFKFKIIKAKITKQKGGSIRLIITHDENNLKIDNSVERIIKNEKN